MGERVQALVERLEAVRWDGEPLPSWHLLLLEHMRVSALWARHLGLQAAIFDIPAAVAPGIELEPALVQRLDRALEGSYVGYYVRQAVSRALSMAAIRDAGAPLPDLPDPYEPAIMLFERGGSFAPDCAGVFWETGYTGIPRRKYRDDAPIGGPVIPLDHDLLDEYDLERAIADTRWPGGETEALEALDALWRHRRARSGNGPRGKPA